MAIQNRRGAKKDFDATKMLPGEIAVTTDGTREVYAVFAPGDAKELASTEEVEEIIQIGKEEIEQKKEEALAQFPNYEDKLAELEVYKANSIIQTSSGTVFHETDCAAVKPINIKLFGKSTQDGTPSMETPIVPVHHGESGSIENNLLSGNYFNINNFVEQLDVTIQDNGFAFVNKTQEGAPNEIGVPLGILCPCLKEGDEVYLNYELINGGSIKGIYLIGSNKFWSNGKSMIITQADLDANFYVYGVYGQTTIYKNIIVSKESVPFEPYAEQPFTFQTPNGLRGIPLGQTIPDAIKNSPIHMSGVYWDTVEQRYYIGDTKNEDGKDVQRIGEYAFTGHEYFMLYANDNAITSELHTIDYNINPLCTHGGVTFANNNFVKFNILHFGVTTTEEFKNLLQELHGSETPLKVLYVLTEPIITESTDQYDVVMNYPNTTIVNDEGAYMEVEYVCDTQKHIEQNYVSKEAHQEHENRIAELEKAIVNS